MTTGSTHTRARVWSCVAVALAVTLTPGCSMAVDTPPTPSPPDRPLPARPTGLDIGEIDPCSVLDDQQRLQLGVRAGKAKDTELGVGEPSRGCAWRNNDTGFGYNFQTIRIEADRALTVPGSMVRTINGFGAVQNSPEESSGPGIPPTCQLTIDVNDGQAVRVQVQSSDSESSESRQVRDDTCMRAESFARSVMTTLVNQQR